MNKNTKTSITISAKSIKQQISYHTTIVEMNTLVVLDSICKAFQEVKGVLPQTQSIDVRLLLEYFQGNTLLHTITLSNYDLLVLDAQYTLSPQYIASLIHILKSYIPDKLNWTELNNSEDFIFDKIDNMLDFQIVYDGFEIVLNIDPKKFWKKNAKNYFTKPEIQALKNQQLVDLELKIDVIEPKILQFAYVEIVVKPELEENLKAKLLKVLQENIFIQKISNLYQKKNQILYRPLFLNFQ